jgi:hypothetical protein
MVTRTRLIVTLYVHCLCYFTSCFPLCWRELIKLHSTSEGRESAVGIATRYGLDGPGIESQWGLDFPHLSRPVLGPVSLLYNEYRVFIGGKAAGAWRWPPTPSSTEVKERVKLYLYSPTGPSWRVIGRTFYSLLPTTTASIRTILTLRYLVYSKQYDTGNSVHTETDTLKKRLIIQRKHTKNVRLSATHT